LHLTVQSDAWLLDVQFSMLQGFGQKRLTVVLLNSLLGETSTTVSSFNCRGVYSLVCQTTMMKDSIYSFVSPHFLSLLASSQTAAALS